MAVKGNIVLKKFSWTQNQSVLVTGFMWLNNEYLSGNNFAEHIINNSSSFEDFKETFKYLNGQFSIIIDNENEIWVAVGHTWSYPLFYTKRNDKVFISDEPQNLVLNTYPETDPFSEIYFLTFGVTPLGNTLVKDIFQVQPGEIICFKKHNGKASSFMPISEKVNSESNKSSEIELKELLLERFEKYFDVIKDKQVLLPLTRGYDSRLLASLLKEFGHKNVICVTWGRSSGDEIETAKRVADVLGYNHFFIDSAKIFDKNFTKSPVFNSYINYAGHWSSMPFLYEFFGVKELIDTKIIDESTVALPGHPGDFIRGDHLSEDLIDCDRNFMSAKIISKFGTTYPVTKEEMNVLHEYIYSNFFALENKSVLQKYEQWDLLERQCKFIGNSSQVYPYFGVVYLMPLFDYEVLDFFRNLSLEQKIGKNLYFSALENHFFKKLKIDFDLKTTDHKKKTNSGFKNNLLKVTPPFLKKLYYPMNDNNYYREITQELRADKSEFQFIQPVRPNDYNSYIIQWYLFSLQHAFKNNQLNF